MQASEVTLMVLGIENAGKTSILRVLDDDKSVFLSQLKPTKGIERSKFCAFGMEFLRWDLGGQAKYRDKYLANKDRYFGGLTHLIYVIDVQETDPEMQGETIDYLSQILRYIQLNALEVFVAVLFHKYDPEVQTDGALMQRMQQYTRQINEVRGALEVFYYPTSIYEKQSLIDVFSHVITRIYPHRAAIDEELREMQGRAGMPLACVADARTLLLSEVTANAITEDVKKRFHAALHAKVTQVCARGTDVPNVLFDGFDAGHMLVVLPFTIRQTPFFLAGLLDVEAFPVEDPTALDQFVAQNAGAMQRIVEHLRM